MSHHVPTCSNTLPLIKKSSTSSKTSNYSLQVYPAFEQKESSTVRHNLSSTTSTSSSVLTYWDEDYYN